MSVWNVTASPLRITPAAMSTPGQTAPGTNAVQHTSSAAIFTWTSPDELLLQHVPGEGRGRLCRWNVATGMESFPLHDAAYFRPERDGPARPLPGQSFDGTTETVVAVSADGRAAATRRLNARNTPEELFIRDLDTGAKLGEVRLSPFPGQVDVSAGGHRVVFADTVEPGRMRVYDVSRGHFLMGVGEPGALLAAAFERLRHGQVTSSGSFGSGNTVIRYEVRQILPAYDGRPSREVGWASPVRNFGPDGSLFAAEVNAGERSVGLWEMDSGRRFGAIPAAGRPVWSSDGRWLAVRTWAMMKVNEGTSQSGEVGQVWEVLRGVPTYRLPNPPQTMAFSPDGRRFAASSPMAGSILWDVEAARTGLALRASTEKLADRAIFLHSQRNLAAQ